MIRMVLAALATLVAGSDIARPDVPVPASAAPAVGKTAIGINLAPVSYFSREAPFIDRFKMTGGWKTNGPAGWGEPTADMIGTNGYPARQPDGLRFVTSVPLDPGAHRYVLTYSGTARFTLDMGKVVSSAPGRIVFDDAQGGVLLFLTTAPDALIHDIHVMRAEHEAAFRAGAILNPDFVALIKHFSALRMLDWNVTNGSQLTSWSQRAHLSDHSWTIVPIEVQIAAANAANADLWFTVPAHADDDYIRQATTLIRDQLAPGLKLHLEYSNEVWNNSFEQSGWAQKQADTMWGIDSPQWIGREQYYGYRAAQMARIARDVFGAQADGRLSPVLATFLYGGKDIADKIAKGVGKAKVGTIPTLFREYAITTYFGDELSATNSPDSPKVVGWATDPAGLDKAFQQLSVGGLLAGNNSLAVLAQTYVGHAARAKAWGLKLVAYEGGPSWYYFAAPDKAPYDALMPRILADPRMGTLTTKMIADFGAAGGTLLMQFNDVGAATMWGPWPMQPDLYTSTPRSKALIEASGR